MPRRPTGVFAKSLALFSADAPPFALNISVTITPGAIVFTRMLREAYSTAVDFETHNTMFARHINPFSSDPHQHGCSYNNIYDASAAESLSIARTSSSASRRKFHGDRHLNFVVQSEINLKKIDRWLRFAAIVYGESRAVKFIHCEIDRLELTNYRQAGQRG